MTSHDILRRRARSLARLLTAGTAVVLIVLARVPLPLPTDGPTGVWVTALRWALVVTLIWAVATCASAAHHLREERRQAPASQMTGRLVALLLVVAGWTMNGSAQATTSAAPVAAVRVLPAPVDPLMGPMAPIPLPAQQPANCAQPSPDWLPAKPPAVRPADRDPLMMSCTRDSDEPATVVVRRGDTLWSIVARHLGPGADPETIAVAIPTWHATNRAVIGADPNLLLVGQVLSVPAAGGAS
ncbi:LysM peptidoglycan-binding domain-containing protein [Calidifontibacter terrae]